jgi:agmatine deiminase
LALNDWDFNAWGNKYQELIPDSVIPADIARFLGVRRFISNIVLEGGAIEVNGRGLCLTTEQCLLSPARNPKPGRAQLEGVLKSHLGVNEVIWLAGGICGDDTDGHVDNLARFVNSKTIVCAFEEDPYDPNYEGLQQNYSRLLEMSEKQGEFEVIPFPMPDPVDGLSGRLPASYVNFYIANNVVFVPGFGQEKDEQAVDILRPLFPGREVVSIDCRDVVWGLGAIHCLTLQQPKV